MTDDEKLKEIMYKAYRLAFEMINPISNENKLYDKDVISQGFNLIGIMMQSFFQILYGEYQEELNKYKKI